MMKNGKNWGLEQKTFDDRNKIRQKIFARIATNASRKWHRNKLFSGHRKGSRKRKREKEQKIKQTNIKKKRRLN